MQEEKNSESRRMDEQTNKYLYKNVFFGDRSPQGSPWWKQQELEAGGRERQPPAVSQPQRPLEDQGAEEQSPVVQALQGKASDTRDSRASGLLLAFYLPDT